MKRTADQPVQANVMSRYCPSHSVLEMVADRWSILVLYALKCNDTQRYSQIQNVLEGISQKMLTQTLKSLERNGLVSRISYPVVPPHTEYDLTELGHSLDTIIAPLAVWAMQNMPQVLEARTVYDARQDQGAQARA
jgi:DNA-binding HxlR family transcriptional regulator